MTSFNFELGPVDTSATPTNDRLHRQAEATVLTDRSKMSFGKHRGQDLGTIPESYLRWLWENGKKDEDSPMHDYIAKRLRLRIKAFVSPHPEQYWAVLEDEWCDPRHADIFQSHPDDALIPF